MICIILVAGHGALLEREIQVGQLACMYHEKRFINYTPNYSFDSSSSSSSSSSSTPCS